MFLILEVIKIKRKIVLHGPSTLTVSLPVAWVKKFNVKKGEELNVEEFGNELRITTEKEFNLDKKQIKIGNLKRLGRTYVTASYRQGYDEVNLSYEDSDYSKVIQDIISKETTGFEIIKQNGNTCLIKDLTGNSKNEFDIALRRIWLLVTDMANESLDAIKKKDISGLENIKLLDYSINKFSNYCLRVLIKKGHVNFRKTPLYYYLIKRLETIADNYKDLCTFYSENPTKINNNLITLVAGINEHLKGLYELFYKYDEQKMEDLFRKTKFTYYKINPDFHRLCSICRSIKSLLSVLVEINL